MSREPYEDALRQYIEAALGAWGGVVIFARQKEAPRPPRPFVSVDVLVLNPVGLNARRRTLDGAVSPNDGVDKHSHTYNGTVTVDVFADNHRSVMRQIVQYRDLPAGHLSAHTLCLTVGRPVGIIHGSVEAGPEWEQRSQADLTFSWASLHQAEVPAIQEANVITTQTLE